MIGSWTGLSQFLKQELTIKYQIIVQSWWAQLAKLYNITMEQKVSTWVESQNKWTLGQTRFRPKHFMVGHLVTLRVIMEESRLQGNAFYCCFVDFQKTFDIVSWSELWNRIVEIGMSLEYWVVIAWLYEKFRCQLKNENGFLWHFLSNMGVKQGCPLSSTLFGLCIDKLK